MHALHIDTKRRGELYLLSALTVNDARYGMCAEDYQNR